MRELPVPISYLHAASTLHNAIQNSLGSLLIGVTAAIAPDGSVPVGIARLALDDAATSSDEVTAASIAAAHDPVFLTLDKATIQANGTDTATITVKAPKPGAAAVTLTITTTAPSGSVTSQDDPITLAGGIGTETITALDPCTISISVKNAFNRTTDSLTISAR